MLELTLPLDEALRLSPGCTSVLDEGRRPSHPDLAERLRREGFDPEQPIEMSLAIAGLLIAVSVIAAIEWFRRD